MLWFLMNGPVYDRILDSMDGEELYDFFRPFSEQALFNGTYKKCAARQQTMYICVHLFLHHATTYQYVTDFVLCLKTIKNVSFSIILCNKKISYFVFIDNF